MEEDAKKYGQMMQEHHHVMEELHTNNMKKADAIASYDKRISQIGLDTVNTANKMNATAKKMDATAHKVDKLHMAMKAFVKVIDDAVGVNNTAITGAEKNRNTYLN